MLLNLTGFLLLVSSGPDEFAGLFLLGDIAIRTLGATLFTTAVLELEESLVDILHGVLNLVLLDILLAAILVLLVHLVLLLAHLLSDLYAVLLALLVPAPFVDLRLTQSSVTRDQLQSFLRPSRLMNELIIQLVQLLGRLALALPDDALLLPRLLVKIVAAACCARLRRHLIRVLLIVALSGLLGRLLVLGRLAGPLAVALVIFSVLLGLCIQDFVGQVRLRSIVLHVELLLHRVVALDTCARLLLGQGSLLLI